ncbi:MAG: peptidase [Bacteroidetes bacterium]|nr:peptidase [Bacteroidota bacterium]
MAVYFIFWDGVGYGTKDPKRNPFFAASLPTFRRLLGGEVPSLRFKRFTSATVSMTPVNTTLRVPGLPQSGTGQTAIMTGLNASKFVGKHFGPHPYSTLIPVIKDQNLFVRLRSMGKRYYFANGYPRRYLDYITGPKGRVPTIALSYLSAGGTLNTHEQIKQRLAVSADIAGSRWEELGHPDVLPSPPAEAGALFHTLGRNYDLTFFEYFVTDHAGHAQEMPLAVEMLERMDGFLEGILSGFDPSRDLLLMISDHGNIEDLSVKTHTMNPVPLILIGNAHAFLSSRIRDLTHITPAVISYLSTR